MNSLIVLIIKFFSDLSPHPEITGFYGYSQNAYIFVYQEIISFILIILVFAYTTFFIRKTNFRFKNIIHWSKNYILRLFFIVFLVVTIIQINQHFKYFLDIYKAYSNKTYAQKEMFIYGDSFYIAKVCQKILKNKRLTGKLITDVDLKKNYGMTFHRNISYLLYPTINFRAHNQKDQPDCILYFQKNDAEKYIPPGYKIKYKFNNKTILAIRKNHVRNL